MSIQYTFLYIENVVMIIQLYGPLHLSNHCNHFTSIDAHFAFDNVPCLVCILVYKPLQVHHEKISVQK